MCCSKAQVHTKGLQLLTNPTLKKLHVRFYLDIYARAPPGESASGLLSVLSKKDSIHFFTENSASLYTASGLWMRVAVPGKAEKLACALRHCTYQAGGSSSCSALLCSTLLTSVALKMTRLPIIRTVAFGTEHQEQFWVREVRLGMASARSALR